MFVLTKKENGYGESAMACPGVMEKVDRLFPEGFYLLPSSVHECLITRKGGGMDLKGGGGRGWAWGCSSVFITASDKVWLCQQPQ